MSRKRASEKDIILSSPVPPRHKPVAKRVNRVATSAEEIIAEQTVESTSEPTREQIALLAYSYWEARGCQGGSPEEDWLRAEQELAAQYPLTATA